MKKLDVCLRLILPGALEARILDSLLEHPQWVGPFVTHRVEGHGDPESIATAAEQVRGSASRVQIEILMDGAHVAELLQELRQQVPPREVVWWTSAVAAGGTLE